MTSSQLVQRAELQKQIRAAFAQPNLPQVQDLLRAEQRLLETIYGKLAS